MRRTNEEHAALPWKAHELTQGFELLDVWRFPIRIAPEVPFSEFPTFLDQALHNMQTGAGPAALLFRLRGFLGRILMRRVRNQGSTAELTCC